MPVAAETRCRSSPSSIASTQFFTEVACGAGLSSGALAHKPLPEPLEDLAIKGIPPEPLKEFLEDQGFKSLLNRMIGGSPNTGATVRNDVIAALDRKPATPSKSLEPEGPQKIEIDFSKYETVIDEAALDRWIDEARAQGYVAVDTETDCIDCIVARLAGISLATAPNRACYVPVGHTGADRHRD